MRFFGNKIENTYEKKISLGFSFLDIYSKEFYLYAQFYQESFFQRKDFPELRRF